MTLHGRQQLRWHKNLYVRSLRPVAVAALFVCAVVSGIRAMATFPWVHTKSVSCLSPAKRCLLLLHGAQALPSCSSAGSCCCLSFTSARSPAAWLSCTSSQNHCVCPRNHSCGVCSSVLPACIPQKAPTTESSPPCRTILAGLPAHLSVYFPVFLPRFTPCCVFKCNLCAGGLSPLPPSPTSRQSPCFVSPAKRLWNMWDI